MLVILQALVGLVLLLFGRRLYWMFVAGIGFLTGLALAPRLLPPQPDVVIVLLAVALAVVGAFVAVVAQTVIVAAVGFLAGGGIGVLLVRALAIDGDVVALAVYAIAGIAGAWLSLVLFGPALIVLSSLAGAGLVAGAAASLLDLPSLATFGLLVGLAVLGVLIQARFVGGASPRARGPRA